MKFEFDDFGFKEEVDLMNLESQFLQQSQMQNKQTLGFNLDSLYNAIDNNEEQKIRNYNK